MDSKQHIEEVLATRIRPIFEQAAARLDALAIGEKVPATELAKDLAKEVGMTGPQLYPVLLFLFKDFPDIEVRRGAHGGLFKVAPKSAVAQLPESTDKNDVPLLPESTETVESV